MKVKNSFYQTASIVVLILGWVFSVILYFGKDSAYQKMYEYKALWMRESEKSESLMKVIDDSNVGYYSYMENGKRTYVHKMPLENTETVRTK